VSTAGWFVVAIEGGSEKCEGRRHLGHLVRLKIRKVSQFNIFGFFLSRLDVLLIFLYLRVESLNVKSLFKVPPVFAPRSRFLFMLGKF